jgi:DNA-binding NarL/FixJ family response regulator
VDAVTLALELLEELARPPASREVEVKAPPQPSPLTIQEREILRMVAEGLTSKEIGQQLFLSPGRWITI